jgi:hypothetical protein
MNGGVCDPTAIQDEPLLSHHIFKFILIKLDKAPFLRCEFFGNQEFELGFA